MQAFSFIFLNYNSYYEVLLDFNNFDIYLFNKYKLIDCYYALFTNLYLFYRQIKKILIILHFNLLKLYIIFINDTFFFNSSYSLFLSFFKFKKLAKEFFEYYFLRYLKLNRKYKNYYKFYEISNLKFFFFIIVFAMFILMCDNKTSYHKKSFITYPILFYALNLVLCSIIVPLFYYQFIGALFSIFLSFMIFYIVKIN